MEAVKGRVEVYLDGGIRQGTDVLKALALGARAVFIGRPVLWGLAYQVCHLTQLILDCKHAHKYSMYVHMCNLQSEIACVALDMYVHDT